MADYLTPQEVRDFLNVKVTTGIYSDANITTIIKRGMNFIYELSGMVFNNETKRVREYHDITKRKFGYFIGLGIPVYLGHKWIKTQLWNLKVWNGGNWEVWVGNGVNTKEQGRDKDFWLIEEEGILYLRSAWFVEGGDEILIEYDFGRTDLPADIKEYCLLYVARDLLMNEFTMVAVPEGFDSSVKPADRLRVVNERLEQLGEMIKEWKIPVVSTLI